MIKKIFIFALVSVLLTGCYDNFDLEDRDICTAVAIDYSDEEGYTIMLSVPALEKEDELKREIKTQTGKTLKETAELIDQKSSKGIYYGHTQAVILGMGLLRNERAIGELTEYLKDNVQIDKNILISAAYDIKEIMELDPGDDKLTGFYISGFYDNSKDERTFVNKENLLDLLKERAGNRAAAIPLVSAENESPCFNGIVVLQKNTLKGVLTENAAYGFMWITDRNFNGTVTTGEPAVSTEILEKKTSYDVSEENGARKLNITIDATGNMWNYSDDEIKSKASEYLSAFKAQIASQARMAVEELYKMDCDFLGKGSFEPRNVNIAVNLSLNFV